MHNIFKDDYKIYFISYNHLFTIIVPDNIHQNNLKSKFYIL
jgi:hypothetical protein